MRNETEIKTACGNLTAIIDKNDAAGFSEQFVVNPILGAMLYRDALAWILEQKEGKPFEMLMSHFQKESAAEFPEFIDE